MTVDHTKNIIEVQNVSFSYGNGEVLRGISLDVHKGDYLGVIGPNGAGKTTLLKIMLGILQPTKGSIKLFGQEIKDFKDWSKIGYVPQKATSFDVNFPATVLEVALMGVYGKRGIFHGVTARDRETVKKALDYVGMWEFRDRLIGDLSGGQQQRVFVARALANEPEVIFLDEPTSGIDEKTQGEFYALLKKLNNELLLTLVLVSHDIERLVGEVMHIACIDHTLTCHSSPAEYLKEGQVITLHHHENS